MGKKNLFLGNKHYIFFYAVLKIKITESCAEVMLLDFFKKKAEYVGKFLTGLQRLEIPFQWHTSHKPVWWPTDIVYTFICSCSYAVILC